MPERSCFYLADERAEAKKGCFYQFMRRLEKEGLITLKEFYIGGTKLEAAEEPDADSARRRDWIRFRERKAQTGDPEAL